MYKVISYKVNNKVVESVATIFKGDYDKCLSFYSENKDKYKKDDRHLEIMFT